MYKNNLSIGDNDFSGVETQKLYHENSFLRQQKASFALDFAFCILKLPDKQQFTEFPKQPLLFDYRAKWASV